MQGAHFVLEAADAFEQMQDQRQRAGVEIEIAVQPAGGAREVEAIGAEGRRRARRRQRLEFDQLAQQVLRQAGQVGEFRQRQSGRSNRATALR